MSLERTTAESAPRTGRIRGCWRLMTRYGLSALLLVGIVWSGGRVLEAFFQRQALMNTLSSRQPAYAATATALAPTIAASDHGASGGAGDHDEQEQPASMLAISQFITNTPAGAPPPSATPLPAATATPQRTPVALPTFVRPPNPDQAQAQATAIPSAVPVIPRQHELINILLLGGDDEVTGDDSFLRTDTMIIVSINLDTRTVAMLSLPRDLYVYIPSGTMQRLNTAYAIGENIGWTGGGFGLLRQTIFYNLGLQVHYFARANFSGFEQIIDTLGGVEIAVDCAYEDWYPVDDFDPARPIEENYYMRLLPVGYYEMDGQEALWYARTRRVADDFDRGRRQQKLLRAMWRQARANGLVQELPNLWGDVTAIVETDLPFDVMLGLLPVALDVDLTDIELFTFTRWYHTTPWQLPAGDNVQLPEPEPIRQLLTDFYTPPTDNQLALASRPIGVYNGTSNPDWDRVAAERLLLDGFLAYALGPAEQSDHEQTTLIDRSGESKGSLLGPIAETLNIGNDQIRVEPDPARDYDYVVVLGENYNSCTYAVLAPDQLD